MFPVILIQVEILVACPKFLKFVRHLQLLANYCGLFRADAVDADASVTVRLLIPKFIEVAGIPFRCHTPSDRQIQPGRQTSAHEYPNRSFKPSRSGQRLTSASAIAG